MSKTTETIEIAMWGDWSDLEDQIKSRLFGWMLAEAGGTVKNYLSDLYWDAQWIRGLTGAEVLHWFVREHGTWSGSMAVAARDNQMTGTYYEIDLRETNGVWYIVVEREVVGAKKWVSPMDETVDDQGRRVGSDG